MVDVYFNLNENNEVGSLVAGDGVGSVEEYEYHFKIKSMDLLNQSPITLEQMEYWSKDVERQE